MNIIKSAPFVLLVLIAGGAFAQTTESYQHRTPDGKTITVYYVLPPVITGDTRVLFTMHGTNRNAIAMARSFRTVSVVANVAVIAPEFTESNFNLSEYHRINVRVGNAGRMNPYSEWSFHHIDRIFDEFVIRHRLSSTKYILYGYSAGGQFTGRTAMLSNSPKLDFAIAGGAGTLTPFNENANYPFGIRNILEHKNIMTDNLRNRKLYILLGSEEDVETDSPAFNELGITTLERGRNFYLSAAEYARQHNINFNWEYTIIPNAGHQYGPTIPYVLDILTGRTNTASTQILTQGSYFPATSTVRIKPPASGNQPTGQERVYGTWYADSNSVFVITRDTLTYVGSSASSRYAVRINSFSPVTNDDSAFRGDYPDGFRIRGVYTESDDNSRPAGGSFDLRFFPSTDNSSMVRRGSGNVWNRY